MEFGLQRDYLLGQHRSDVTNERSFRDVRNLRGDVCFCVQQPTLDAPEPPNYLPDALPTRRLSDLRPNPRIGNVAFHMESPSKP